MSRDAWAERRELLEYVLKDHVRRGVRVVTPPQCAMYDSKVLDQLNVSALVKQLQTGGHTLELARCMLPAASNGAGPGGFRSQSVAAGPGKPGANGDNPFGAHPPQQGGAMTKSQSFAADNPFGGPSAAGAPPKHAHHASADNPFGPSDGGSSSISGGGVSVGGGSNPFAGGRPSAGPSTGGISGGDAAMFAKKKGPAAGSGTGAAEPPVTTLATSVKLSYNAGSAGSSDAVRGRQADQNGVAGGEAGPEGASLPLRLELPQLETGQTDEQLKDLAYLIFAACATGTGVPQHATLLPIMRQQLLIDEARASDVARVLRHIQPGGEPHLIDQPHPTFTGSAGGWRPSQRASLELLLRLVTVVRPSDFEASTPAKAFKGFLRWKDVTVAVLERQIAIAVENGYNGDKAQLRKMLARMHGAARRADVRGEGDFEEEEYSEATRVLAETAGQLASACTTGLRFPWGVRVRLCEILVTTLFDTLEEGSYIDEAALVQQFVDTVFFPALGISASAALAVNAWVHFGMYVATGCKEQRLLKQLKQQISRLAAASSEAPNKSSDPFGLGADASGPTPPPSDELSRDGMLAAQVASHIVDFLYSRLCNYHVAFPKGDNMAAMLDIFVFACKSRGDGPEKLAELLVEAVCGSTTAHFHQLLRTRLDSGASNEARLLEMASVVHDIYDADVASYCAAMAPHMPSALGVAGVQLHMLYGQHLNPWLNMAKGINPSVLDVFRTANALEQRLSGAISKALAAAPHPPAVSDVLSSHRRWDLTTPLKAAMMQWVSAQVANMQTWTARALQTEKWRPMGVSPDGAHSTSASEVSRMTAEALDALYGMDVPMPPEVPQALLQGIDAVLRKYVTHVNDKLGPLQRLIPAVPPLTRYKKDVVVKNEQAERDAGKGSVKGVKKMAFLASVPPIDTSPDHTNISAALTAEVLATAACSLHFLLCRAEALLQTARERQQQSAALHPTLPPATPPAAAGAPPATTASWTGSPAKTAASSPDPQTTSSPPKQTSEAGASVSEQPEPLTQARTALLTGMQYACKFLATRVVFWDQRAGWLEFLYRHHVTQPASRIEPLLDALNKTLGGVCPGLPDPVRNAFAKHLLIASMQATERVLLDGGPCRWFMPADVKAIDQDLHKLRSLFHADGDGLDRELIDGELERVRRLLPLMRVEVGPLMDLLKTARTHGTAQLMGESGSPAQAYDESTIMRVLAHRPERNGSKLLKTLYKLSKRLK